MSQESINQNALELPEVLMSDKFFNGLWKVAEEDAGECQRAIEQLEAQMRDLRERGESLKGFDKTINEADIRDVEKEIEPKRIPQNFIDTVKLIEPELRRVLGNTDSSAGAKEVTKEECEELLKLMDKLGEAAFAYADSEMFTSKGHRFEFENEGETASVDNKDPIFKEFYLQKTFQKVFDEVNRKSRLDLKIVVPCAGDSFDTHAMQVVNTESKNRIKVVKAKSWTISGVYSSGGSSPSKKTLVRGKVLTV